jgi:hypothetical protein
MEIILNKIREVLTENRIDDVKKKFPTLDPAIIDYFVTVDPSGNNKYLEWMAKAMTHRPTTDSIMDIIDNYNWNDGYWEDVASYIGDIVKKFHQLLPYMVHTNEQGKKEGTTDLYLYKFTDSEMIHYLKFDIDRAQERKDKKDELKKYKSEVDKIFDDKNWLVVRAKTWEASCHYGAGTKWCTTSRDTD